MSINTRLGIATIVENMSNVKNQRDLVNDTIQIALNRFYEAYDWNHYLMEDGVITLVAPYETGTIAIVQGDTTATIAVGVVSSAFVGRKIQFEDDTAYYMIISADTGLNTITLDAPYQGTTLTAGSYSIFKDTYRLRPDIDKYKLLRQMENGIALFDITPTQLDRAIPMPTQTADPLFSIMSGTRLDTYSTGTLSASGSTITGVGTAWTSVEGLGRSSRIRIGSNIYTIKSVDSATQLTTYESIGTVAAGTAYEIAMDNLVLQVYHIPADNRSLRYRYYRKPVVMANDYDVPDMPSGWHWLLIYGSLSFILLQKGDISKAQQEAELRFITGIQDAKLKIGDYSPDRIKPRKSFDRFRSRRDGLEKPNYDYRYSSPSWW